MRIPIWVTEYKKIAKLWGARGGGGRGIGTGCIRFLLTCQACIFFSFSEITDRTILKLFEIDQATGAPKTALGGHDVRESGGLGPGNKGGPDGGSQYASMSTIADAAELPGGKTGENTDMKV